MATKKFYYNGNLMRTSQNHIYTHALIHISGGKPITCSASYDGCLKEKNRQISNCRQNISNCQAKIKALQAGKAGYYYKDGRNTWYSKFDPNSELDTIEHAQETIDWCTKRIETITNEYIIVELEMR